MIRINEDSQSARLQDYDLVCNIHDTEYLQIKLSLLFIKGERRSILGVVVEVT